MEISVRRAEPRDAGAVVSLLLKMHAETAVPLSPPNEFKIHRAVIDTIEHGIALVAVDGRRLIGSIGGVAHADWWSTETRVFELWWYVRPEHRATTGAGLALYRGFKKAAGDIPVRMDLFNVGGGDPEKVNRMCVKLGLVRAGSVYVE